MKSQAKTTLMIALSVLIALQLGLGQVDPSVASQSDDGKLPLAIVQGPLQAFSSTSGDPSPCTLPFCYWFQVGAVGDSSTHNSVGASATIRTVFDQVNQDAHSYWVGSTLANNAFVQVGYLNGLSTTGQPYCCAWFYEYFPPGSTSTPPFIGPEGSAGPIGSWHTYSMHHVGNGVWSFYMDGNLLGSSPAPGAPNYLGSGATSSGGFSPAGIAEVAQASSNTDIIGPAEFKSLNYTNGSGWQPFPVGVTHIGYGATSLKGLANPYGVAEIYNTPSDFLAGSYLPQPPNNSQLWPTTPPILAGQLSFSFADMDGGQILPAWISLRDGSNLIFYSSYQNQIVPAPSSGNYTVNQVIWHAVNVATSLQFSPSGSSQTIPVNVFSVSLLVVGLFYSIPVSGATVIAFLPDSTNETMTTDANGHVLLTQLPPSAYMLRITVPRSIGSVANQNLLGPSSVVIKVVSFPELLTIIVPPILAALAVVGVAWSKEKARRVAVPIIPAPAMFPVNCRSCGQPLSPGARFCTNCGTLVSNVVP